MFPLSLFPRLQCSLFICISLFVVSTLQAGFWPDFAPPSGNTKDGPNGKCPQPASCVPLSRQVSRTHCHCCHSVAALTVSELIVGMVVLAVPTTGL